MSKKILKYEDKLNIFLLNRVCNINNINIPVLVKII